MWVLTIAVVLPRSEGLPVGGVADIVGWLCGKDVSISTALSFRPGYRGRGCWLGALSVGDRWMLRLSIPFSM